MRKCKIFCSVDQEHPCIVCIDYYAIAWFRVQFGKNTHEWVFQRPQNSTSPKEERCLWSLKNSRVPVFPKLRVFPKLHEKSCYYLLIIYTTKLYRTWSHACVTCKIIYSIHSIVNISRRKNICHNNRTKTMCFNYKNC